jgi:hypothetical protein
MTDELQHQVPAVGVRWLLGPAGRVSNTIEAWTLERGSLDGHDDCSLDTR